MQIDAHSEEVQRCLRVVWLNKAPDRYVPKAIGRGSGWEVWDRKKGRAVEPRELAKMTFEQITEKFTN